jgi:hypothetical protein
VVVYSPDTTKIVTGSYDERTALVGMVAFDLIMLTPGALPKHILDDIWNNVNFQRPHHIQLIYARPNIALSIHIMS